MTKLLKKVLVACGAILATVIVIVAGYAVYLHTSYYRIADHQVLPVAEATTPDPGSSRPATVGTRYTAITFNIGFGAYTPDYSFFMDTGEMKDGTATHGTHGKATSKESVEAATSGALDAIRKLNPNVVLFQEIDTPSDRSHHVNQLDMATAALPAMSHTYAENFHSAYLALPLHDPHGYANAGLATYSTLPIRSAERRSFPIDESFPDKFFDLDRAFTVQRIPTHGGKELVIINSHMSAYDDGTSKEQQLALLHDVMTSEYNAGNYVILGGDWNHVLFHSDQFYPTEQKTPGYIVHLDDSMLPSGYHIVRADNIESVATCRSADIPYEKGVNFLQTIDGFIVSDNVEATAHNVDTDFAFSDHNPVELSFELR